MNEVVSILPEIVAGYAAGYLAERIALKGIAVNQHGVLRFISGRNPETTPYTRKGYLQEGLACLAITGAIVGAEVGLALNNTHSTRVLNTPALVESIDHTFGTGPGGDGTDQKISAIATGVAASKGLKVQAVVAHNSTYEIVGFKDVTKDRGYGSQSLPQATSAAISTAYNSSSATQTNAIGSSTERNAAVLIINDGDSAGSAANIYSDAKAHGNMQVFDINLGPNNSQTAQEQRLVAQETGGKYWQVSKNASATSIAATIKSEIVPKAVEHQQKDDPLPWYIVALATTGLGAVIFRGRRRQPDACYQSK